MPMTPEAFQITSHNALPLERVQFLAEYFHWEIIPT